MSTGDSGIGLDENFDLVIDNSGDVASFTKLDELKKDLSGALTAYIDQQAIGSLLDNNKVAEIESDVRTYLEQDERVVSVQTLNIRKSRDRTVVQLEISINSIYGGLQFNVN